MKNTKIFLLAGNARCGKDTVGTIINDYYVSKGLKVVRLGFADYIKLYAKKITDWMVVMIISQEICYRILEQMLLEKR